MSILCHRRSNRLSMFPKKPWFRQRLNVRPKPSRNANGGDGVPRGLECAWECIYWSLLELFKNDDKKIDTSIILRNPTSWNLQISVRMDDSESLSNEWLASAFQLFWVANTWRNLGQCLAILFAATRYNERQVIFTDLGEAVHAGAGMPDRKQQQDTCLGSMDWEILWQLDASATLKMGPVVYTLLIEMDV